MSPCSAAGGSMAGSDQGEPATRLAVAHRAGLQPFADQRVAREVTGGEAGIGLVPDLGRRLVPPEIILELLLVLRSAIQQEAGAGIADAVREDEIEPIGDLVDEVVHVAVEAAVIIAAEEQPPLAVEKDPAGEMDRADAGEAAAGVDLADAEIENPEDEHQRPQPKAARLDVAEGAELIGDVVVLEHRQRFDMRRVGPRRDDRIG